MQKYICNISDLRMRLQSIAFLMSQENKSHEARGEMMVLISDLSAIESSGSQLLEEKKSSAIEAKEIAKVTSRLKLWAKRPDNFNSNILTAYLRLKRSGVKKITEKCLKNELSKKMPFESNFAQMKIIADKNHGKIFEVYGGVITLWAPIEEQIHEYERHVFCS
jgi:hypothetical protein